jgi:hypothetical protein
MGSSLLPNVHFYYASTNVRPPLDFNHGPLQRRSTSTKVRPTVVLDLMVIDIKVVDIMIVDEMIINKVVVDKIVVD